MATSRYIKPNVRSEQRLFEDIVIESLKLYGRDVYYLPRTLVDNDRILGEDIPSRFDNAYKIEMYIENTDGFDGEGDLFSKFGVEIRDQVTFVLARRRWDQTVSSVSNEIDGMRPREGDLIYLPLSNSLFEIMRVEHEDPFYQIGNLVSYKMYCELFEYNDEDFDTDILAIDDIEVDYAYQWVLTLTPPTTATGTAAITADGRVSSVTVTEGGTSYTVAPSLTFGPPDIPAATAAVTLLADSAGNISSISIVDSGRYYLGNTVAGDLTYDVDSLGTTITQDIVGNLQYGRITSITTPTLEQTIYANPVVEFPDPAGVAADFTSTGTLTFDPERGQVTSVTIVDGGANYSVAPTATFGTNSDQGSPHVFNQGDIVWQDLAGGAMLRGEVQKYSDSDNLLYLAHVGATDGKFHQVITDTWVYFDSDRKKQWVTAATEDNKISETEQNDDFDAANDDILDFSETNPFGEPS